MNANQEKLLISRIGSIDALRAVVLFGILIVHTVGGFEFPIHAFHTSMCDWALGWGTRHFLSGKCAVVFSTLFGVSFYLILKKPEYSSWKFVWRCMILFVFGLINKLFYTCDALCWYAIWGMILVCFRYCKPITLIFYAIVFHLLSIILSTYSLGDLLFPGLDYRYGTSQSFVDILLYPYALRDYLCVVFNGGVFNCLSVFLFGYCLGCLGIVEKIDKVVSFRVALAAIVIYILLFAIGRNGDNSLVNLMCGMIYAILVVYLYNTRCFHYILRYLESYGRLGLTNYSMQGVFGVTFIYLFRDTIFVHSLTLLMLVMILFYLLQSVFSYVWLLKYKYGPMEYIWRSMTNGKFNGNKK